MIVVLDNLNNDIHSELKSEIIELIDLFKETENVILFSADILSFKNIATIENRSYNNVIGEVSTVLEIKSLNDNEYEIACKRLWAVNKALIQHGGHKTSEYREPRTLRYLSAIYKQEGIEVEDGQGQIIQAIPDFGLLKAVTESLLFTASIRDLFKKYAEAFIEDEVNRKKFQYLNIAASGSGAVSIETAKKIFSSDLEKLLASGFITIREFNEIGQVLFRKLKNCFLITQ
jgi:hypothetical protein